MRCRRRARPGDTSLTCVSTPRQRAIPGPQRQEVSCGGATLPGVPCSAGADRGQDRVIQSRASPPDARTVEPSRHPHSVGGPGSTANVENGHRRDEKPPADRPPACWRTARSAGPGVSARGTTHRNPDWQLRLSTYGARRAAARACPRALLVTGGPPLRPPTASPGPGHPPGAPVLSRGRSPSRALRPAASASPGEGATRTSGL